MADRPSTSGAGSCCAAAADAMSNNASGARAASLGNILWLISGIALSSEGARQMAESKIIFSGHYRGCCRRRDQHLEFSLLLAALEIRKNTRFWPGKPR
jgi:hypothetical protein